MKLILASWLKPAIICFCLLLAISPGLAFASTDIPATPPTDAELGTYLEWVFNAGMALGYTFVLLAFAIGGVYLVLSGVGSTVARAKSGEWFRGGITGFLVLTLIYFIIVAVNPKLAIFGIGEAIKVPGIPPIDPETPVGLYLYENADCTGTEQSFAPGRVEDLKSAVVMKSMKIVSQPGVEYWVGIYDQAYFSGQCRGNDGSGCQPTTLNKSGIKSVIVAEKQDSGGNIIFYRNPSFDKKDGWVALKKGGYYRLENLYFDGDGGGGDKSEENCTVPKEKQDCLEWNTLGQCLKRQCPNLAGDNIASIQIEGDYIVTLGYTPKAGQLPIPFCQTYPANNDVNKVGPKQVKWDTIKNYTGYFPNELYIIGAKK